MTKPTTILKHLILAGGVLLVFLFSLLLPARLTYAADLFYEMIETNNGPATSGDGQIEMLDLEVSPESVVERSRRRVATGTSLMITPNSAVANAGNIPVVIKSNKPFIRPVTPTTVANFELQYVIEGNDNTFYGVLPVGSLSQGVHDLTVNNGGQRLTLSDAFTVTDSITPKPYLAMVYMACDNNLASSCERLFNNLELAVSNNPNIRVVAFWDGDRHGDSAYYLIQPDNNPYARASYDETNYVSLGEVDSADPSTLVQFAAWAKSQYPYTYSFLSLVDHGSGWAPDLYPGQPGGYDWGGGVGGLFWDDTSGNVMPTKVLADALQWMTSGDNEFDVIYIDACQMGTVEVITELAPYADYIISHENLAWATYPYEQYFSGVNGSTSPENLAQQIAEVNRDSWPSDGHPSQISVIETALVDDLMVYLNAFTDELRFTSWASKRADIQEAALNTAHVDENIDFVLDDQDSTIDLYHFASQFQGHPRAPASVQTAAQNLMDAIGLAVDTNYTHSGTPWVGSEFWDMSNFHGLSIYFPLADEWKRAYYNSDGLPGFASQTSWDDFIQEWYNSAPPAPPTEECDAKECLVPPMHISLIINEPISDLIDPLVWVPVSLNGAHAADDVRGVQISVEVDNNSILAPANDLQPRMGTLFPSDSYTYSVRTSDGWDFLLTDISSTDAISGSSVMVELPFRFQVEGGCADLEFDQHILKDSRPSSISHYHEGTRICIEEGSVKNVVKLERRPPNTHGGIEVTVSNGTFYSNTLSDPNGNYNFTSVPKTSHTVGFDRLRFLYYSTTVTVTGPTIMPPVILCAGDMNSDRDIDNHDESIMAVGIIPVGFPGYDLNADSMTDVGDLIILQQNLGKVSPNEQCDERFARRANNVTANSIERDVRDHQTVQEITLPLPAHKNVKVTLRLEGLQQKLDAIGTRFTLPAGVTVSDVELAEAFADGFLDWEVQDGSLFIVATPVEGQTVSQDSPIVEISMNVPQSGDLVLEAANPEGIIKQLRMESDAITSVYLPMFMREHVIPPSEYLIYLPVLQE